MPYLFSCPTCLVLYVLLCLTCLVSYMLSCLTCLISTRSCTSRVLCPTCSRASCVSCPMCSLASRASYSTCSRASRAPCPACFRVSRSLCLTTPTVKQYYKQSLLKEYYYRVFFISDINLQDPLIYLKLTSLIHQPAFIRKPTLWRGYYTQLRYFHFNHFKTLYQLKNKE